MKKTMRKFLALSMTMAIMLTGIMNVGAVGENYTISVSNDKTLTNIDIKGDVFYAYQILAVNEDDAYTVNTDYKGFFGDECNITGTTSVGNATKPLADLTGGDYDYAVVAYLNGLSATERIALASNLRTYIEDTLVTTAHSAIAAGSDAAQIAYITGLDEGYYFVMNPLSTAAGLSVNAYGTFVDLTAPTTIHLKQSLPTIDKKIWHDDKDKWDIVGDSQIGDEVKFFITSDLPTADVLDEFEKINANYTYSYVITDTMTAGLDFDTATGVKVYTDEACNNELDADTYYTLTVNEGENGFTLSVNVKALYAPDKDNFPTKLYTKYSAILNDDATVVAGSDINTAKLEYSNDPNSDSEGTAEAPDVHHYTFEMDVTKVNENGEGLADAEFGLYVVGAQGVETKMPLTEKETDTATGMVSYYYNEGETGEGNVVTKTVTLDPANGEITEVTGRFTIYGLNDGVKYILKEEKAPEGYNQANPFEFEFIVDYTGTDVGTIKLNENGADNDTSITIINRKEVYLPSTGGMGTVLFPVIGGGLMLGAAAVLVISKRKNAAK